MKLRRIHIKAICAHALILLLIVVAVAVAGCQPQQQKEPTKDPPNVAAEFAWSPESDCTMCHGSQVKAIQIKASFAGIHEAEDTDCITCHTDAAGLKTAHKAVTYEHMETEVTRLKKTSIDESACLSCHGSTSELILISKDSKVLTDKNGTVVNPHDMPVNTGHNDHNCGSCHRAHQNIPASKAAPDHCESCHHQIVYECHTCH